MYWDCKFKNLYYTFSKYFFSMLIKNIDWDIIKNWFSDQEHFWSYRGARFDSQHLHFSLQCLLVLRDPTPFLIFVGAKHICDIACNHICRQKYSYTWILEMMDWIGVLLIWPTEQILRLKVLILVPTPHLSIMLI